MRIMWPVLVLLSLIVSGCASIMDIKECNLLRDPNDDSYTKCIALRKYARLEPEIWARAMEIRAKKEAANAKSTSTSSETRSQAFMHGLKQGLNDAAEEYVRDPKAEIFKTVQALNQARYEMGER